MLPLAGPFKGCHAKRIGISAALAAMVLSGCTKAIPRMDANFNAQPLGPPQQSPVPTPPNDQFTWLIRQPLTSAVVANPGGGNWVMTVPLKPFIVEPDTRHQFLLASSERFTTNPLPGIRGTFSLRLVGQGEVGFGLRAIARETGFVGGGSLESYPFGETGEVGMAYNPSSLASVFEDANSAFPLPVTAMAGYRNGTTVDFYYTLAQVSHTFHLSVGGGALASDSTTYSTPGPIAGLELWLWLRNVSSNTKVFVNNVKMEELN